MRANSLAEYENKLSGDCLKQAAKEGNPPETQENPKRERRETAGRARRKPPSEGEKGDGGGKDAEEKSVSRESSRTECFRGLNQVLEEGEVGSLSRESSRSGKRLSC